MEVYAQQVALQQLKDENTDKARLAQKLAELEVRQQSTTLFQLRGASSCAGVCLKEH